MCAAYSASAEMAAEEVAAWYASPGPVVGSKVAAEALSVLPSTLPLLFKAIGAMLTVEG